MSSEGSWKFRDSDTEISVWKWTIIVMAVATAFYFWGYSGMIVYPLVAIPLQYWISTKMEQIDARYNV